jgi:hypothetical protein
MKVLKIAALVLAVVIAIVIWAAPVGPMPGIFIGGTQSPMPDVWSDTRQLHEIKLAVGEGLIPRVVIVWVVQVDGDLHVVGAKESGWTSAIGDGGPVRLRMGDKTYAMQATLLATGWQPIVQAYLEKYQADYPEIVEGFPSIEEAGETTSAFRLTAPDPA